MNIYCLDDIPEHLRCFFAPVPQIGLEPTPQEFVARLVGVFREVRRVLRDDGTLWLNMGDSYVGGGRGDGDDGCKQRTNAGSLGLAKVRPTTDSRRRDCVEIPRSGALVAGLQAKNMLGMPWRLAFALQDDGWILRQDIVWHKPNPMPESVRDRCTKAHEYIFLLVKRPDYYFDPDVISERSVEAGKFVRTNGSAGMNHHGDGMRTRAGLARGTTVGQTRNKRSVWKIATSGFKEAHFATFPPELPRLCISAGTSQDGCCAKCGAPRRRVVERRKARRARPNDLVKRTGDAGTGNSCGNTVAGVERTTKGWEPTCRCGAAVVPCTVLDPFLGSGTTVMVARMLGRDGVGIELSPAYAAMAERRIADAPACFPKPGTPRPKRLPATLPLFD